MGPLLHFLKLINHYTMGWLSRRGVVFFSTNKKTTKKWFYLNIYDLVSHHNYTMLVSIPLTCWCSMLCKVPSLKKFVDGGFRHQLQFSSAWEENKEIWRECLRGVYIFVHAGFAHIKMKLVPLESHGGPNFPSTLKYMMPDYVLFSWYCHWCVVIPLIITLYWLVGPIPRL